MNELLTAEQRNAIRGDLVQSAKNLLGVPYVYGAEWVNYSIVPQAIDCSELIEGLFNLHKLKMPDGSQNQYDFTITVPTPEMGDLAFFGRGGHPNQIYHVGMVFSRTEIIEARAFDPTSKERGFETGKVILRPIETWMKYKNFVGFTRHPKLL